MKLWRNGIDHLGKQGKKNELICHEMFWSLGGNEFLYEYLYYLIINGFIYFHKTPSWTHQSPNEIIIQTHFKLF